MGGGVAKSASGSPVPPALGSGAWDRTPTWPVFVGPRNAYREYLARHHYALGQVNSSLHEPRSGQPRRGDIIETVVGGRLVKAEVGLHYLDWIWPGQFAAWKIEATEI
jgi:hypothetical protein